MSSIEDEVARITGPLARALETAIRAMQAGVILSALERWILERNAERVTTAVPMEVLRNALAAMQTRLAAVRELGWQGALHGLPKTILTPPLLRETLGAHALTHPAVLEAIRRQDLSRIQGITAETEAAIREILQRGLAAGKHPTILARELRNQIGLNRVQAKSVAKYRARLEASGRPAAQIERMVARETNRQLRVRSGNIAATEVARAQQEGFRAQLDRMVRDGVINPAEWEQEWVTSHFENVCPVCKPLDGQRTPIGGMFQTSLGPISGPPAHPRCPCIVRLVMKGLRKGEPTAPARDVILQRLKVLG